MSMCDTCAKPGACCTDMAISTPTWGTFYPASWPAQAAQELAEKMPGHPFIPLRLAMVDEEARHPEADGPYGVGRWACSNLMPEGRCGDYENRPQLCRDYVAGSDPLCVMHVPLSN